MSPIIPLCDSSSVVLRADEARYKLDDDGEVVVSRLVEATLEELSRATGGHYLRATGAGADLEPLLERIADMEKKSYGSDVLSSSEERFQWPLALAVVALALYLTIAPFRRAERTAAS